MGTGIDSATVVLQYSVNGGARQGVTESLSGNASAYTVSATDWPTWTASDEVTVYLNADDLAENSMPEYSWSFTVTSGGQTPRTPKYQSPSRRQTPPMTTALTTTSISAEPPLTTWR